MSVREGPHQAARAVGDVEVKADLEPVQGLQGHPQREEQEERPPSHLEMQSGGIRKA